jgi:putative membrane protein
MRRAGAVELINSAVVVSQYRPKLSPQICGGENSERTSSMVRMLLHWILNAVALLAISHYVSGFYVLDLVSALIAVVVIGLFNATLGLLLKIITFPLGILTFGLFFLIINAVILKFASEFVPGFRVETFGAAFIGALALSVLHLLFGFFRSQNRAQTVR